MKKVLAGVDQLLVQENKFQDYRLALVTNNVASISTGESSRTALLKAGFKIIKLFSPEHGLSAKGEDGAFQRNSFDALTQLPVISLYGDHLKPAPEELYDIDMVLFDIPDIGCRFYTYLWTMTYVMEACAACKKPLIILDRPNPLGGDLERAEGPLLDEERCRSFIGRWNIPVRHSCTMGELATYFAAKRIMNVDLTVIKVQNWNRKQTVLEADWLFTPTSPAILDAETALLYAGMGLLEGINVNEGRGTGSPFKVCGAPWINGEQLNRVFMDTRLPGIKSTAITYIPTHGLYAGEKCQGLRFFLTDHHLFTPVKAGLQLLQCIISLYPGQCKERLYPTVANPTGKGHLDKLIGIYRSFEKIGEGEIPSTILQQKDWKEIISPYLLY
ncbi:MAG: DUF1343 domain-containing protein [Chitinophagaceae bacterium]|nr:DUF1343 domain-containing protein [Chitinophagaceae bacterium]